MRLCNGWVVLGAMSCSLTAAAADFPAKAWRCPTTSKNPNDSVRFQFEASASNPNALTMTYQWESKKSGSWKPTSGTVGGNHSCTVSCGTASCVLKATADSNRAWVFELATKKWSAVSKANIDGTWHTSANDSTCKLE